MLGMLILYVVPSTEQTGGAIKTRGTNSMSASTYRVVRRGVVMLSIAMSCRALFEGVGRANPVRSCKVT